MGRSSPPKSLPPSPGRRPTFAGLFATYFSAVVRWVRRDGVPEADCDDVAQQTFLAVLAALPRYEPDPARPDPEPWLKTIARYTAWNHRTARGNRPKHTAMENDLEPADEAPLSDERMIEAQQRKAALALLDALPFERRQVFVMSYYDDLPMPAIAAELGIPVDTGYTRLKLARRDLKAAWARKHGPAQSARAGAAVPLLLLGAPDLDSLLAAERTIPAVDPAMQDRVWSRLARLVGREALTGAAPALGLGRALAGLTVSKVAGGAALTFLLGVGAGTIMHATVLARSPAPVVTAVEEPVEPVVAVVAGSAAPSPSIEDRVPTATVPRAGTSDEEAAAAAPIVTDSATAERLLLQRARALLMQAKPDPEAAILLLERHKREFKNPQLADEREGLRRRARKLQEARQGAPDAGQP